MKIEKLTDNKIRIIINLDDLREKNIDSSVFTKPLETQTFLLDVLNKAEKEVGFYTDGCKLLIEAFSSDEGSFVFTITKYEDNSDKSPNSITIPGRRKVTAKKKTLKSDCKTSIFKFSSFEEFCNLCNCLNEMGNINLKGISKNISLYLYNDTYYLVISDINIENNKLKHFYSIVSEFASLCSQSNTFENKLIEHGKAIIKKNAINTGIKYFVN